MNGYATVSVSSNGRYALQNADIICSNALGICSLYCNAGYSCSQVTMNGKQAGKVYVGTDATYGFTQGILYCPSDNDGLYNPSCHLWCEAEQSCTKAKVYAVGGIGGYESGLIEYYCRYSTSCVAMEIGCGATYSEICYITNAGILLSFFFFCFVVLILVWLFF